ncbi:MAG: hypothetical protein ACXV5J_10335 [Candidatus Angelobacter sp.]
MFDGIATLYTLYIVGFAIALTVSGWIVTVRVRRRMKKSLGRKATDLELASLKTWMRVEETEQREEESKPIHPS